MVQVKLLSSKKQILSSAREVLVKKIKKISFVRLPKKQKKLSIMPSVSGRGYGTFYKYECRIYRAVCFFKNLQNLNLVLKVLKIPGLHIQTRIL